MSTGSPSGLLLVISLILPLTLFVTAIHTVTDKNPSWSRKIGGWALLVAGVFWAAIDGMLLNLMWSYLSPRLVTTVLAISILGVAASVAYRFVHKSWSWRETSAAPSKLLEI